LCFKDGFIYPDCWAERGSANLIIDSSLMFIDKKIQNNLKVHLKALRLCCLSNFTAAVFPLVYCCGFL